MNSNENIEQDGGKGLQDSHLAWLLLAIAVYIVRIMPWAMSEFWYDEVLTIGNFLLDHNEVGLVDCVFRNYPIANNHILSSKCKKIKVIPKTGKKYVCTSLPLYGDDGQIKLVVQHLRDAAFDND